jgi:hypothetical protein
VCGFKAFESDFEVNPLNKKAIEEGLCPIK